MQSSSSLQISPHLVEALLSTTSSLLEIQRWLSPLLLEEHLVLYLNHPPRRDSRSFSKIAYATAKMETRRAKQATKVWLLKMEQAVKELPMEWSEKRSRRSLYSVAFLGCVRVVASAKGKRRRAFPTARHNFGTIEVVRMIYIYINSLVCETVHSLKSTWMNNEVHI